MSEDGKCHIIQVPPQRSSLPTPFPSRLPSPAFESKGPCSDLLSADEGDIVQDGVDSGDIDENIQGSIGHHDGPVSQTAPSSIGYSNLRASLTEYNKDIFTDGSGSGDNALPAVLSQTFIRKHNENTITAISEAKDIFGGLTRAKMETRAQADANAILDLLDKVTEGISMSVKEESGMKPINPTNRPTAEYVLCNLEEAVQLFKGKVPPRLPVVIKGACEDLKTIEGFLEELKIGETLEFHDFEQILEGGQEVYTPRSMKTEEALALFEARRNLAGLAMNFLSLFCRKDNAIPPPFANQPDYSLMGCARANNGKEEKPVIRDLISSMTFHLLATKGAGHLPHIDRHGTWTTALCEEGKKLWLQWPNLDLETINSREVPGGGIAILLEKGDMLIQPPNTLHAPLTLEDCLMTGTMHWHSSQLLDILRFTKAAVGDPAITNEGMAAQFIPTMRQILKAWKTGKAKYAWPPDMDMNECLEILEWLDQGCRCKGKCSATKSIRCKCKRQNRVCDTRCHFSETYKECCQERHEDGPKSKRTNPLKRKAGEAVDEEEQDAAGQKAKRKRSTRNRKAS